MIAEMLTRTARITPGAKLCRISGAVQMDRRRTAGNCQMQRATVCTEDDLRPFVQRRKLSDIRFARQREN